MARLEKYPFVKKNVDAPKDESAVGTNLPKNVNNINLEALSEEEREKLEDECEMAVLYASPDLESYF